MNFEESVKRLDEIVSALSSGETDIDKSLLLFEEGSCIIRECNRILDEAEQKVVIMQNGGEESFENN